MRECRESKLKSTTLSGRDFFCEAMIDNLSTKALYIYHRGCVDAIIGGLDGTILSRRRCHWQCLFAFLKVYGDPSFGIGLCLEYSCCAYRV